MNIEAGLAGIRGHRRERGFALYGELLSVLHLRGSKDRPAIPLLQKNDTTIRLPPQQVLSG